MCTLLNLFNSWHICIYIYIYAHIDFSAELYSRIDRLRERYELDSSAIILYSPFAFRGSTNTFFVFTVYNRFLSPTVFPAKIVEVS